MVRVNKHKLTEIEDSKLFNQLNKYLSSLQPTNFGIFLDDLLGVEERLVLAKRVAIIIMLKEGYSYYRIADTLKISVATASRVDKRLHSGKYDRLIKLLVKNKTDYKMVLDMIESIFTVGGIIPKRYGLDRYRGL